MSTKIDEMNRGRNKLSSIVGDACSKWLAERGLSGPTYRERMEQDARRRSRMRKRARDGADEVAREIEGREGD